MPLSVSVQPRDQGYVKLGTQQDGGGGYGVIPGSIEFDGQLSEYGVLGATFRLKLNPRYPRGIIEHFSPVVISDGTDNVFSGYIIEAPTTFDDDAEVVVHCDGWGQHAKDDCMDRVWVESDLSRFSNGAEAALTGSIALYTTGNVPSVGGGSIILPCAKGLTLRSGRAIADAVLDLGPNNVAKRVVVTWDMDTAPASASFIFYIRCTDVPDYSSGYGAVSDFLAQVNPGVGPTTTAATVATGRRYLHLFTYWAGADVVCGADCSLRIKSVAVFTDTADESGNASILKASTVISETIAAVCPLWSTDTSKIATTSLSLPQFPPSAGWRFGNELLDLANSFHGYKLRVSPDPVPVPEFQPQDSDYSYVVGAGEYTLSDPAAQNGREVFSRVIAPFEDAAGVRADAYAVTASANSVSLSLVQPANPSFDVDTSSWTALAGTITRDTVVFDTTPASGRLTTSGGGVVQVYQFLSGLQAGTAYRVQIRYRKAAAATAQSNPIFGFVAATVNTAYGEGVASQDPTTAVAAWNAAAVGSWLTTELHFTTTSSGSTPALVAGALTGAATTVMAYIDNVTIFRASNSIVDRRGRQRTMLRPADGPSTSATQIALSQVELDAHQYPPFKGTILVRGRIRTKGGGSIPVSLLPSRVGDSLLVENLSDPNTQASGRRGIIQYAKYTEETDTCEITIDDPSAFVEILRNRLALATR